MAKTKAAPSYIPKPESSDLFSDERIRRVRVRNKVRRLTELCLDCKDLSDCRFGQQVKNLHEKSCKPQVGDEFRYCAGCLYTLGGECEVDKANLSDSLHQQLAHCTSKRGYGLPLLLIRFDVIHRSGAAKKPAAESDGRGDSDATPSEPLAVELADASAAKA